MEKFQLFCFRILILHLFFSGFLRIYLLPQYSNIIYIIPMLIYIPLIVNTIFQADKKLDFFVLLYIFATTVFQLFHYISNDISFIQVVYGLFLYSFPAVLVTYSTSKLAPTIFVYFRKVLCFAIYPNLVFSILQTYVPGSVFVKSTSATDQLTSYGGIARAFGTFSAPVGFSFFLAFGIATLLAYDYIYLSKYGKMHLFFLLLQIPISGSRTAIFQTSIVIFAYFLITFLKKRLTVRDVRFMFFFIFAFSLGVVLFKSQFAALVMRFNSASVTENTSNRIISSITSFTQNGGSKIFGDGLGFYANASSLTNNNFIWIENDLQRNFLEFGQIFGTFFVAARFVLSLAMLLYSFFTSKTGGRQALIFWSALFPLTTFGQFFGQGTLSLAGWLILLFSLNSVQL